MTKVGRLIWKMSIDEQRLLIKSGCTGVWQISGRNGNDVDFYDKVKMDIEYINTLSIFNELKLILKTMYIMIKPNMAY